jgi:hypothetical protein
MSSTRVPDYNFLGHWNNKGTVFSSREVWERPTKRTRLWLCTATLHMASLPLVMVLHRYPSHGLVASGYGYAPLLCTWLRCLWLWSCTATLHMASLPLVMVMHHYSAHGLVASGYGLAPLPFTWPRCLWLWLCTTTLHMASLPLVMVLHRYPSHGLVAS